MEDKGYVLGHLLSNLDRRVLNLFALVLAEVELLQPDAAGLLSELRDRRQIVVRREMPEKGGRDAHQRPVGQTPPAVVDDLDRLLVDDDLVVTGLDEPTREVLELLAGLDQQVVALGDLDGDPLARVAGPDVQTRVARAAVDGQEVEVGVEAGQDGVLFAVLLEVGRGGREEMGAARRSVELDDQGERTG